jgi:hypothetical protein
MMGNDPESVAKYSNRRAKWIVIPLIATASCLPSRLRQPLNSLAATLLRPTQRALLYQAAPPANTTLGICDGWVDNTAGSAGDASVLVRRGKAWFLANSTADAVTQAQIGKDCYVVDSRPWQNQ